MPHVWNDTVFFQTLHIIHMMSRVIKNPRDREMTRFSNTYAMSHVKNTNTLKVMFFRYFAYYSRDVTCEKHVKMWNGVIFRHFTFHEHVKCVIFRYFALFTWCQVWKARVHMKGHDFQILHIMHAMSRVKSTWIRELMWFSDTSHIHIISREKTRTR